MKQYKNYPLLKNLLIIILDFLVVQINQNGFQLIKSLILKIQFAS